jgi:hypothetical protein
VAIAPVESPPFIGGQPTPDSGVLTGLDSPSQALSNDLTATADGLRRFDLEKRRTGVPDREEQLGALVQARSAMTPSHC